MKNIGKILLVVGLLLAIPLLAMQFTSEVNWTAFDFLVMGSLLLFTGLVINYIRKSVRNVKWRLLMVSAAVVIFLLVWAELAVGIFNTPIAGS